MHQRHADRAARLVSTVLGRLPQAGKIHFELAGQRRDIDNARSVGASVQCANDSHQRCMKGGRTLGITV